MIEPGQAVSDWAFSNLIGPNSAWANNKFRDGQWAIQSNLGESHAVDAERREKSRQSS